jgi:hypothetical protein
MIRQSIRLTLLVGLVIFGRSTPEMVIVPGGTVTLHHVDGPCGPIC